MTNENGNLSVLGVFALRSLFIYFSNHWKKLREKFQTLETIPCKVWFLPSVVSTPWKRGERSQFVKNEFACHDFAFNIPVRILCEAA
jgi:hypothetical protein